MSEEGVLGLPLRFTVQVPQEGSQHGDVGWFISVVYVYTNISELEAWNNAVKGQTTYTLCFMLCASGGFLSLLHNKS